MIGHWVSSARTTSPTSLARVRQVLSHVPQVLHTLCGSVFSANSQAKKTCRKEKKGRRGGETNANRAGTGDAGAAITARTSNALKAFCYQRCTCRSKKNKKMKDLDQKKRHGYMIEQTPITFCSFFFVLLHPRRYCIHHRTDTDYI